MDNAWCQNKDVLMALFNTKMCVTLVLDHTCLNMSTNCICCLSYRLFK